MIYRQRYDKLISHYINNPTEGFVEKHHIIPKCMGGDDSNQNLVLLPTRAHFIAHYLLHKAYPENRRLAHAFAMMGVCNGHQHRKSKLYESSKKARSLALTGVPRPEWVKEKLRKPKANKENYKKPKSKQHAENISKSLKGKSKTKESVQKMLRSRESYLTELRNQTAARKTYYRLQFMNSGLSRKEFYPKHPELSDQTLKRYLSGL